MNAFLSNSYGCNEPLKWPPKLSTQSLADSSKSLASGFYPCAFQEAALITKTPLSVFQYSHLPLFSVNNATVYVTLPVHYKLAIIQL